MNNSIHTHFLTTRVLCVFFVISLVLALESESQTLTPLSSLSIEELKSRRFSIEGMSDLDTEKKAETLKMIDQAIGYLELQVINQKKIQEQLSLIENAPGRLKKIGKKLENELPEPKVEDLVDTRKGIETIEQIFQQNEAKLAAAQTQFKEFSDSLATEQTTMAQAPEIIIVASKRLKEIQISLEQISKNMIENDLVASSRVLALEAEKQHLQTEITLNEQRQNGHSLLISLLKGERDLAERTLGYHQNISKTLTDIIQGLRNEDAFQQREDAQNEMLKISLQPKRVQEQFDINIKLSAELERIAGEETGLLKRLESYQHDLNSTETEFETAKRRIELDVLTDVIGMALRSQRINLPTSDRYDFNSKKYLTRMSEISERHFELDRLLRDMPTTDTLMHSFDIDSEKENKLLKPRIDRLLKSRKELVHKIVSGYERIIKLIQEIEFIKKRIISVSDEFGELLDRHLLWIKSSKPINLEEAKKLIVLSKAMSQGKFWQIQFIRIKKTVRQSPLQWIFGACIGMLLIYLASQGKKKLASIAADIDRQTDDTIFLTLQAFGLTMLLSLVWPYLFFFPAIQVSSYLNKSVIGHIPNPWTYTWIVVVWIFTFNLCRPLGLVQIHFRWPEAVRKIIRYHLMWLIPVEGLIALLYFLMETNVEIQYGNLLGVIAICLQCLAMSVFGAVVFRFKNGLTSVFINNYPNTWFCRLRYFWYPAMIFIPVYILWFVLSGYYFSAVEIRQLMYQTTLFFLCLVVFNSLTLRLLMLARRNIALKEAMENRVLEGVLDSETSKTDKGESRSRIVENIVKLSAIDEQTRSLLKLFLFASGLIGLWAIWEPVFPALGVFQDIELWTHTVVSNGVETSVPITLANVSLAVIVILAMFVAVRNLPGLIEVILLNRLPMDAGARFAWITVSRYTIVAFGIFIALGAIGIKWSNMQWLVAALSVGLGFGLQEIVANFISGLIVLFERPFRVGDTVTVGSVSGTVTRIRIRATTIEDWDKKELIVPNKEFITGRIINWSLSDQIIRIKVPVGIAYGSDTDLAEKLLMRAAKDNEYVLSSPEPSAVFLRFGDNSLDYEVRVFIKDIDDWIPMLHNINITINKAFAKHKITIAFPQRDVHLDAEKPIPVKMVSDEDRHS